MIIRSVELFYWYGAWWIGHQGEVADAQGASMEEALQNYLDYLWGEGKEDCKLEIEGPTDDIEVHKWLKSKGL